MKEFRAEPLLALILLGLFTDSCAASKQLPKDFRRCYRRDEHINECLKDAIKDTLPKMKHGLPEFAIPDLDPISLQRMDLSKGQGSVILGVSFKNMTIHNLFDDIKVQKASVDLEKYTLELVFYTKRLVTKGLYEVKGRVMVFPVNGRGHFSTISHDPVISIKIIGKPVVHKDGLIYISIDEVKAYQRPKTMVMQFENVINGDKILSENFNKFINQNWKVVYEEMSPTLFSSFGRVIKDHLKGLFDAVPLKELFPDHPEPVTGVKATIPISS